MRLGTIRFAFSSSLHLDLSCRRPRARQRKGSADAARPKIRAITALSISIADNISSKSPTP